MSQVERAYRRAGLTTAAVSGVAFILGWVPLFDFIYGHEMELGERLMRLVGGAACLMLGWWILSAALAAVSIRLFCSSLSQEERVAVGERIRPMIGLPRGLWRLLGNGK